MEKNLVFFGCDIRTLWCVVIQWITVRTKLKLLLQSQLYFRSFWLWDCFVDGCSIRVSWSTSGIEDYILGSVSGMLLQDVVVIGLVSIMCSAAVVLYHPY